MIYNIGLTDACSTITPLPSGHKFTHVGVSYDSLDRFCCLVDYLLYLIFSRHDIPFFVQQLSEFVSNLLKDHF